MTYAEIVHLIGFAYVMLRVLVNLINGDHHSMIAPLIAVNIILNFYPTLLQQMNKRRIDRILTSLGNRQVASLG